MTFQNKTIQKFISCLVIVSLFAPTVFVSLKPKKAEAIFGLGDIVFDPAHTIVTFKIVAQEIYRQVLMIAARKLLDKMTRSTVNWINSGFHGDAFYVQNEESFFKDIVKFEIRTLVDIYGYDTSRFPFGRDFALNTIDAYKRQLTDNSEHSLSTVITDPVLLKGYQKDFDVGGWDAFLINTQYPQNNYLGFQMIANEQIAKKVAGTGKNAAQKVDDLLAQGQGFLSPQTCPTNPDYNNGPNAFRKPSFNMTEYFRTNPYKNPWDPGTEEYRQWEVDWQDGFLIAKANWDKKNTCPGGLVTTTPGFVVATQITNALGSKFKQTELAAAMGNSLAAVFDALLNKLLGDGLSALSNKINPPPEPDVDEDDFQYLGDSINSSRDVNLPATPSTNPGGNNGGNNGGGFCWSQAQIDNHMAQNPEAEAGEIPPLCDENSEE